MSNLSTTTRQIVQQVVAADRCCRVVVGRRQKRNAKAAADVELTNVGDTKEKRSADKREKENDILSSSHQSDSTRECPLRSARCNATASKRCTAPVIKPALNKAKMPTSNGKQTNAKTIPIVNVAKRQVE